MQFYRDGIIYSRREITQMLIERDGPECYLCGGLFSENDMTIDHYFPQRYGKEQKWRPERIHDFSNLKLACQIDNRTKSDQVPVEGWVFNPAPVKVFPTKVVKSPLCESCLNGMYLERNEVCSDCLLDNSKRRFPKILQVEPKVCDHQIFNCWVCVVHPELIKR